MDKIKFYEISPKYIDYLVPIEPHLFHNKKAAQNNNRKYIGIVFKIDDFEYFAPLSSFKEKHTKMKDSIDFIKIKKYAVINLNNMFPVPECERTYIDIHNVEDEKYKNLLQAEYRYIKSIQGKILKNAKTLYHIITENQTVTALTKRCNDFKALEKACLQYMSEQIKI